MGFIPLPFFPRDVLDEIWGLIESVSEGLPTYSPDVISFESLNEAFIDFLKLSFCPDKMSSLSGVCNTAIMWLVLATNGVRVTLPKQLRQNL